MILRQPNGKKHEDFHVPFHLVVIKAKYIKSCQFVFNLANIYELIAFLSNKKYIYIVVLCDSCHVFVIYGKSINIFKFLSLLCRKCLCFFLNQNFTTIAPWRQFLVKMA